jgi:hypothetical protein
MLRWAVCFEHEADGRQVDEGFRSLDLQLVVFAQATISAEARKLRSTIQVRPGRGNSRGSSRRHWQPVRSR